MNIKFSYLYRDAGNYKQYNEIIFLNKYNLPLATIQNHIDSRLIDGLYFNANEWYVPDLHFNNWNNALDHCWHEFEDINETANSNTTTRDIISLFPDQNFS